MEDKQLRQIKRVAGSHSTRSKLFRWMLKRHGELAEMFSDERPTWKPLAAEFNEMGLAPDGKEITAQMARHTYWRVRRHLLIAARNTTVKPMPVEAPAVRVAEPRQEEPATDIDAKMADLRRQLNDRSGR